MKFKTRIVKDYDKYIQKLEAFEDDPLINPEPELFYSDGSLNIKAEQILAYEETEEDIILYTHLGEFSLRKKQEYIEILDKII